MMTRRHIIENITHTIRPCGMFEIGHANIGKYGVLYLDLEPIVLTLGYTLLFGRSGGRLLGGGVRR